MLGFPAGSWATNCYVIAAGPGEPCLVVDPGQDSIDTVMALVRKHHLLPVAVALTHGHVDHVWSVAPVAAGFDIPAYCHVDDAYRLADPAGTSMAATKEALLAMTKGALELTEPDDLRMLHDADRLAIGDLSFTVRHAPGHTEGSIVLEHGMPVGADGAPDAVGQAHTDDLFMLSGDLLFAGSIGRTDLPGGSPQAMVESLARVIMPAPAHMTVLPGHGPRTTIGAELASNPFLQGLVPGGGSDHGSARRGL